MSTNKNKCTEVLVQNPRATYRAAIQCGMNACLRQITLQRSMRFTQNIVGLEYILLA